MRSDLGKVGLFLFTYTQRRSKHIGQAWNEAKATKSQSLCNSSEIWKMVTSVKTILLLLVGILCDAMCESTLPDFQIINHPSFIKIDI